MDLESNNKQKKVWLESIREISFGRPRFFFVCMHTVKYNLESEQTANTKKKTTEVACRKCYTEIVRNIRRKSHFDNHSANAKFLSLY